MKIKRTKGSRIGLLVLTAVLVLLFYSPLISSEDKETEKQASLKGLSSGDSVVCLTKMPRNNSDFLGQLAEKYKLYAASLLFNQKQYKANTVLKRIPSTRVSSKGGIENTLYSATLVTFVGLSALDFYTTNKALKCDGLAEANPLLEPLTKNTYVFAAVKLGIGALTFYSLKKLHKKNKTLAWIFSITSNIVVGYVVYNNARLIQGAQK